jgi:hypothetical protein
MEHTLISKEEIGRYHIVPSMEDRNDHWTKELSYAVRLGNEFKGKTTITFVTSEGPRTVETTVWSITEKYLHLKGGVILPLNSILEVHF